VICEVRLPVSTRVELLGRFRSSDLLVFIVLEVTVGVVAIIRVFIVTCGVTAEIPKFCLREVPEQDL
jgi:hypothetical protein